MDVWMDGRKIQYLTCHHFIHSASLHTFFTHSCANDVTSTIKPSWSHHTTLYNICCNHIRHYIEHHTQPSYIWSLASALT